MGSKKDLIIIIISVLCLISLVGAEEKESGSKIEPKLIYEKRFDFEIEQGKIGDDGSLFPTIFVTKDNRALFYDDHGRIIKSIRLNERETGTLSEDGKYLIIQSIPKDWWKIGTEKKWRVFNQTGSIIAKGSYNEPYAMSLQLVGKECIFIVKGTTEKVTKLEFYDTIGTLLNSITEEALSQFVTKTNKYYALGVSEHEISTKYILVKLENPRINEESGSWLVIFNTHGEIIWKKQIPEHYILCPSISSDGRYIIYASSSNEHLKIIDRKKDTTIKFKDPSLPGVSAPQLRFINASLLYYLSTSNRIFIFNLEILEKMQQIIPCFQWYSPTSSSITYITISGGITQYLGIVESQNTIKVFSFNDSEELFSLQSSFPINDIKFNAMERKLYVLNANSIKIYKF